MQMLYSRNWSKSILDKYSVKIYPTAISDLDVIYRYIAFQKLYSETAKKQINRIKKAILNLAVFPYSYPEINQGRFACKGYRNLLIDNYMVIYTVDEAERIVYIVSVQFKHRNI